MSAPERVGVVGSRNYQDLLAVRRFVQNLPPGTVVVSGGARGVDMAAEDAARGVGLPEPDIRRPSKHVIDTLGFGAAAHARNKSIALSCDRLVAFLGPCEKCKPGDGPYGRSHCPYLGWSHGASSTVHYADEIGKPILIFYSDGTSQELNTDND